MVKPLPCREPIASVYWKHLDCCFDICLWHSLMTAFRMDPLPSTMSLLGLKRPSDHPFKNHAGLSCGMTSHVDLTYSGHCSRSFLDLESQVVSNYRSLWRKKAATWQSYYFLFLHRRWSGLHAYCWSACKSMRLHAKCGHSFSFPSSRVCSCQTCHHFVSCFRRRSHCRKSLKIGSVSPARQGHLSFFGAYSSAAGNSPFCNWITVRRWCSFCPRPLYQRTQISALLCFVDFAGPVWAFGLS